jgi:hypothetical protein
MLNTRTNSGTALYTTDASKRENLFAGLQARAQIKGNIRNTRLQLN